MSVSREVMQVDQWIEGRAMDTKGVLMASRHFGALSPWRGRLYLIARAVLKSVATKHGNTSSSTVFVIHLKADWWIAIITPILSNFAL